MISVMSVKVHSEERVWLQLQLLLGSLGSFTVRSEETEEIGRSSQA
jgi:hypothetical protein